MLQILNRSFLIVLNEFLLHCEGGFFEAGVCEAARD